MATFAELVDTLDHLSAGEMLELKHIIEKKWTEIRRKEIAESIRDARKESEEGKTILLSSPEEIKGYFSKMMNNED